MNWIRIPLCMFTSRPSDVIHVVKKDPRPSPFFAEPLLLCIIINTNQRMMYTGLRTLVWHSCLHFIMVLHFVMAWSRFVPYWLWYARELWERNMGLVHNQSVDKEVPLILYLLIYLLLLTAPCSSSLYSRCNTKWTMDKAELVGVPLAHTSNCN